MGARRSERAYFSSGIKRGALRKGHCYRNGGGAVRRKHRIAFSTDTYLEKGKVYYLKLAKGEPVTGSLARAAESIDSIEGYGTYGPLAYELAHEVVFDKW